MTITTKSIQMATVIPGTEQPISYGVTGAMRCIIKTGQEQRAAILKRGSIEEVTAELLASVLLSGWGLPVTDPFLVNENGVLAFASSDAGYPNLKQALNGIQDPALKPHADKLALQIACNLANFPLAAVCDEAIMNRDRNTGNILWDGENDVWIDHAYSFGVGDHLDDINKLCFMAILANRSDEMRNKIAGQSLLINRTISNEIETIFNDFSMDVTEKLNLVTGKLNNITQALISRFPKPDDLLSAL